MRSLLFQILSSSMQLNGLVGSRIYEMGAADDEDGNPPEKPFLVVKFVGEEQRPARRILDKLAELWAYDERGSFLKIDEILSVAREILDRRTGDMSDGVWLIQSNWLSTSPDLFDESYRANVKFATFRLVGNKEA